MNITGKSISTWLVTNLTGTILYALIPLEGNEIKINDEPSLAILMLIFGLVLSSPAILFTYLNLSFIRNMRTEKSIRYLYTIFSVLLFISIAALLIVTLLSGHIPSGNDLEGFQLIWAHTLMAVITTVWFAKDIIEQTDSFSTSANNDLKQEDTAIDKL